VVLGEIPHFMTDEAVAGKMRALPDGHITVRDESCSPIRALVVNG